RALRRCTQGRLGLDRDDLADRLRIVREVRAVTGAELDDRSAQSFQEQAAMLGLTATIGLRREPHVELGEAGMTDLSLRRHHDSVVTGAQAARAASSSRVRPGSSS